MKRILTLVLAAISMVANAQLLEFSHQGLSEDEFTIVNAGTILGENDAIRVKTVFDDDVRLVYMEDASFSIYSLSTTETYGIQGRNNPKDADGNNPAVSCTTPALGSVLGIEAKQDGYIYVLFRASSHKQYMVHENDNSDGWDIMVPIGYHMSMQSIDYSGYFGTAGAVKTISYTIRGDNSLNQITNPRRIEFVEDYAKDPADTLHYRANDYKQTGPGVIVVRVRNGHTYWVHATGSKIISNAIYFSTSSTAEVRNNGRVVYDGSYEGPASTTQMIDSITYQVKSDGTAKVVSSSQDLVQATIPAQVTINNQVFSVSEIGVGAFSGCTSLTSVVIPEGVTSIGNGAFSGCTSLTSVVIPEGVTSIGVRAFLGCTALSNIVIPEGVTSIGVRAFLGCTALSNIVIPEGVTSIGNGAFSGCTSLTSVVIPEGVTSIGENAFYNCGSMVKLTIEKTAGVIPYEASMLSESSPAIYVPSNLLSAYKTASGWSNFENQIFAIGTQTEYTISSSAIENESGIVLQIGLTNLSNVVSLIITGSINSYDVKIMRERMPNLRILDISGASIVASSYNYYDTYSTQDNVISGYMFYGMSTLRQLELPQSVTQIGNGALYGCYHLSRIDIPNSVTQINSCAFQYCSGLTSISIGNSVTTIGSYAFEGCTGLTTITLPNSVTGINYGAFEGCNNMTNIELGNSLRYIDRRAFFSCYSLQSLVIPSTVIEIGDYAFDGCSRLNSITSYATTPPTSGSSSFYGVDKTIPVTIPCGATNAYFWANGWSEFTNMREMSDCNQYTITVSSDDESHGTVAGGGLYYAGQTISLSATASEGYRFVQWSDGDTTNPRQITVSGSLSIVAYFSAIDNDTSDEITGQPYDFTEGGVEVELYYHLTAIPVQGYIFTQWDDGNTSNPRYVPLDAEKRSYTAFFMRSMATSSEANEAPAIYSQTYDVLGRQVGENYKGIVIQRGKKELNK